MVTIRAATSTVPAVGRLSEIFCSSQGEGPHVGRRHVFVRLAGCRVGCRFCDTPDSLRAGGAFLVHDDPSRAPSSYENPVAAPEVGALVAALIERHGAVHAVSITGGEPLEQPDFLRELLVALRGRRRLLETAGTLPDALARVIDEVEIVSMDLKLPSVAGTADHFASHERFLRIAARREVYVKVVVNERVSELDWERATRLVAAVAPEVPFVVQPETDRRGRIPTGFDVLDDLARRASAAGLRDVRVIPQVHKLLGAP